MADLQMDARPPSTNRHNDPMEVRTEKKIKNPLIETLLQDIRKNVEEIMWADGLVWYPTRARKMLPPRGLAKSVLPPAQTTKARAVRGEISEYLGRPLGYREMTDWLAGKVEARLWSYIIGARTKIDKVRLVVTESKIEVRSPRPDTTRRSVRKAPRNNWL